MLVEACGLIDLYFIPLFFHLDHMLKCFNKLYLHGLEMNVAKCSVSPHERKGLSIYFKQNSFRFQSHSFPQISLSHSHSHVLPGTKAGMLCLGEPAWIIFAWCGGQRTLMESWKKSLGFLLIGDDQLIGLGLTAFRSHRSLQCVPLPQNCAYFLCHTSQARLLPIAFLSLFWVSFWQKPLSSVVQQQKE